MAKNNGMVTALVAVVAFAVAGAGGYMIGARSAKIETQVVASVNGQNISKLDLYDRMAKEIGQQTADRMIQEALIEQAAKKANVTVSSADVDKEISKIREQIGGEDKLLNALQTYGMTMDQLKQDTATRLKVSKILAKDIKTDDDTLRKFFMENVQRFDKREAHSRHILLATEEEAKAVKAELDKGADFAALAKARSTDPTAKENGGDMGFHKPGNMVAEYDKVVFALKTGQISAPFQSQFGWHVAQLVDFKGDEPSFDKMKAEIKEAYVNQQVDEKFQPWLEDQKAAAKISNTLAPKEAK